MIRIRATDANGKSVSMFVSEIISIDGKPWDEFQHGTGPDLTELVADLRITKAAVGRILLDMYPGETVASPAEPVTPNATLPPEKVEPQP